jgi:hypothetical protein
VQIAGYRKQKVALPRRIRLAKDVFFESVIVTLLCPGIEEYQKQEAI